MNEYTLLRDEEFENEHYETIGRALIKIPGQTSSRIRGTLYENIVRTS